MGKSKTRRRRQQLRMSAKQRHDELERLQRMQENVETLLKADMTVTGTVVFLATGYAMVEKLTQDHGFSEDDADEFAKEVIYRAVEIFGEIDKHGIEYLDKLGIEV